MNRIPLLSKPAVIRKMIKYRKTIKAGNYGLQLVELNYNSNCNFSCQHCYARNISRHEDGLALSDVKDLADQAHDLGVWQWHLQGGEPLAWPDLYDVIAAIDPGRFHFFITTNGWLLTREKAQKLADAGVDRISVSIDSFDEEKHDAFRRKKGAFRRAVDALQFAKEAGMQANINTCITRQNCRSDDIIRIIEFAQENKYTVLFVVAAPVGAWAGRTDLLITEEDSEYLRSLKEKYPFVHRDLYPLFDFEWGCRTMNGLVYITPDGDLFSCPFIHVTIGNIREEPLAAILERGWKVKYFRDYNPKCLVGEDTRFIETVLNKIVQRAGRMTGLEDVFNADDFYQD